ncbi:hypothetical protein [Rhodococcus opacus]
MGLPTVCAETCVGRLCKSRECE